MPLRRKMEEKKENIVKREVNATNEYEREPTKWKINLFSYYTDI